MSERVKHFCFIAESRSISHCYNGQRRPHRVSPTLHLQLDSPPRLRARGWGWGRAVGTKNSLSSPSGTAISNSKPVPITAILPSFAITVGSVAMQNRTYCHLSPSQLALPPTGILLGNLDFALDFYRDAEGERIHAHSRTRMCASLCPVERDNQIRTAIDDGGVVAKIRCT